METDILGFVAAVITTISFVPQVVRIYNKVTEKSNHGKQPPCRVLPMRRF
jgi:uncharacterized protein with PQ loop repeat